MSGTPNSAQDTVITRGGGGGGGGAGGDGAGPGGLPKPRHRWPVFMRRVVASKEKRGVGIKGEMEMRQYQQPIDMRHPRLTYAWRQTKHAYCDSSMYTCASNHPTRESKTADVSTQSPDIELTG